MSRSSSIGELEGQLKIWAASGTNMASNSCFSRCESPPVLPPPDFLSSTVGVAGSDQQPHPAKSISNRPCFSAKTRSLFRQRMTKMRKENSAGPPLTTHPAGGGETMAQLHQRPNKLPLPTVNVNASGKPILERKQQLPCAKGSLSPNPHPWQSKRHKITSPNGCAPKSSLIYDAIEADLLDEVEAIVPVISEDLEMSLTPSKRQFFSPSEDGGFEGVNGSGNVTSNSEIPIPLPHSESIPQQFWTIACGWIPIVGRDIVACLFSRDWQVREASIRRLSREIPNMLMVHSSSYKTGNGTGSNSGSIQDFMLVDKLERKWKCAVEMIAKAAEDKVYKVYSASIKALRTLLAFTKFTNDDTASNVLAGVRPILHSILLKCADGQKRMAELSLETITELCLEQTFQLDHCGQKQRSLIESKSLEFVFQMILEDKDPSWQYTMGKLLALDHLLTKLQEGPSCTTGILEQSSHLRLGREHLFIALDISFQNISHNHSRVAKMALKVFVASANLLTALDTSAFEDVWKLVLTLGPTLQLTLKKKFKIALKNLPLPVYDVVCKVIDGFHEGRSSSGYNSSVGTPGSPFSTPLPATVALMRSTSHSPSRSISSKSAKKTVKRPAPYAKNKSASLAKRKEVNNSAVKLPMEPWPILSPMTPPPPIMLQMPSNLIKTPAYYVQDPMPAILGLAPYQSWKPNEDVTTLPLPLEENYPFTPPTYKESKEWTKSFMLGSGAFSTCFQARDVQTGTLMAVKQIQLNRVQDEAEKARLEVLLQQEISLMSMFDHPNLIRFFGVVQEDAQLNIFVEWMPGGSVSKLLDKHGSFNDNVILKYTYQILQGLDYLHHHGILHRDLKGANLFVDSTGHLLRIGDFGAAACLYTKMTVPGEFRGQLQGTLAFMAPEVLRSESYGRSCDVWSLGCCIIEMATAKAPWNAADISNYYCLMYKIACSQDPPAIPSHLSPGLQDLTARCLQLIPDNRPQARELVHHPVFAELFY